MLGGEAAVREPWRNTYAHLMAEMGWAEFAMNFAELDLYAYLEAKPRATLDAMIRRRQRPARLLLRPAVRRGRRGARALPRAPAYEGEAAVSSRPSSIATCSATRMMPLGYPFAIPDLRSGLPYIEPLAMWQALLGDLILDTPAP